MDVVVVGAGPAGTMAALRAAELGARTTLVTRGRFGGMAAHDGPVPVRTLAHAARLVREARQLARYGIASVEPRVDYPRLLERVREVVADVGARSSLRAQVDRLGVSVRENAGDVHFANPQTLLSESGLSLRADRVILACGGTSRRLDVPGAELAATHSDAWSLREVPASMLVLGGGMTGLQVASIFHAFGSRVQLLQAGPRILSAADPDVSTGVASALREMGLDVRENVGRFDRFERIDGGVRVHHSKDGAPAQSDAAFAVTTIGWQADTAALGLEAAGVRSDARGFVEVDDRLATTAPHIFAAGDVTGRFMIVPPALHDGFVAATNAILGATARRHPAANAVGSFTDPEYAYIGLTEPEARAAHDVVVATLGFDETTRTIIDGRTTGFCKLIAERPGGRILGCHMVGERAVDIVQVVAVAQAAGMGVFELARVPLSYPTYAGILARAAYRAARLIDPALIVPTIPDA